MEKPPNIFFAPTPPPPSQNRLQCIWNQRIYLLVKFPFSRRTAHGFVRNIFAERVLLTPPPPAFAAWVCVLPFSLEFTALQSRWMFEIRLGACNSDCACRRGAAFFSVRVCVLLHAVCMVRKHREKLTKTCNSPHTSFMPCIHKIWLSLLAIVWILQASMPPKTFGGGVRWRIFAANFLVSNNFAGFSVLAHLQRQQPMMNAGFRLHSFCRMCNSCVCARVCACEPECVLIFSFKTDCDNQVYAYQIASTAKLNTTLAPAAWLACTRAHRHQAKRCILVWFRRIYAAGVVG